MPKTGALMLNIIAAAFVGACASGANDTGGLSIAPAAGPTSAPEPKSGLARENEAEIDCKKLTGRMQIRILEMRTYAVTDQTSGLSRSMHSAGKTVFGGTSAGIDPQGEHARDLAELEMHNRQLASQDCKSYDIQQSLAGQDTPPQPTVDPPSKSKAAAKAQ
jgi:hypothetical protein